MTSTPEEDTALRALVLELRAELARLRTALDDTLAALEVATTNAQGADLDYHYHSLSDATQLKVRAIRRGLESERRTDGMPTMRQVAERYVTARAEGDPALRRIVAGEPTLRALLGGAGNPYVDHALPEVAS